MLNFYISFLFPLFRFCDLLGVRQQWMMMMTSGIFFFFNNMEHHFKCGWCCCYIRWCKRKTWSRIYLCQQTRFLSFSIPLCVRCEQQSTSNGHATHTHFFLPPLYPFWQESSVSSRTRFCQIVQCSYRIDVLDLIELVEILLLVLLLLLLPLAPDPLKWNRLDLFKYFLAGSNVSTNEIKKRYNNRQRIQAHIHTHNVKRFNSRCDVVVLAHELPSKHARSAHKPIDIGERYIILSKHKIHSTARKFLVNEMGKNGRRNELSAIDWVQWMCPNVAIVMHVLVLVLVLMPHKVIFKSIHLTKKMCARRRNQSSSILWCIYIYILKCIVYSSSRSALNR